MHFRFIVLTRFHFLFLAQLSLVASCDDSTGACENTFDCDIGEACSSGECVVVETEELRIERFRANATTINVGDGVEVTWTVVGAENCTINGAPVTCSGTTDFFPDTTTTYTLRGGRGTISVFRDLEVMVVDAGVDAGPFDDAGLVDAGLVDAGLVDAGLVDAGPVDAGPVDAGLIDAGPVDAGPVDAGPPAVGVSEAAVFVVGVLAPEVRWTQTGAVACAVDGVFSELNSGFLLDPTSTGAHTHTVTCQGSVGDTATTSVSVWWGNVEVGDLDALDTSAATVIVGDMVLNDDESLQAFFGTQNVVEVSGELSIRNNTELTVVNGFGSLVKVGRTFAIEDNSFDLANITLEALAFVGRDCIIQNNNVSLTGITLEALVFVKRDFIVGSNWSLTDLAVGALASVGSDFILFDNSTLTNITLEALTEVGGDFTITFNDDLPCTEARQLRDQIVPLPATVAISPNDGQCL